MRTVTFSDPAVAQVLNADFVAAWRNRIPKFHNCDPGTERWIAERKSFPTKNIVTFFLTPELKVLHYFTGFFSPEIFLEEAKFVADLRREVYTEPFRLQPDAARKFRGLHAKQAERHKQAGGDSYLQLVHEHLAKDAPDSKALALERLLTDHVFGNSFEEVRDRHNQDKWEAEVTKALVRFESRMKTKGLAEDDRIAAIVEVSDYAHPRVLEALRVWLTGDPLVLRLVAIREIGKKFRAVKEAAPALLRALEASKNQGSIPARIVLVRALGNLRAKGAVEVLNRLLSDADVWVVKAAVDALAALRSKSSIEPMIDLLSRLEGAKGGSAVPSGGDPAEQALNGLALKNPAYAKALEGPTGATDAPEKASTRREVLKEPVLAALRSITNREFATAAEWAKWWRQNRSKFEPAE